MRGKLIEIIRDCAPGIEQGEILDDTSLLDDLEYDSLCIISLFEEIEKEFGVNSMLYEDIYIALQSVGSLYQFLEEKIKEKKT